DGKLYASTGDAQNGDNAQNTNSLNGKVLRLNPDGTVPSDNPFGNYVGNYGWPACEGTSGTCGTAGYIAPKRTYPTAEGSCSGIAVVRDVVYIACERGTRLYRAPIIGSALPAAAVYFNGTYGRLRTVEPAPDGGLWLTTSNLGDKDSIPDNSKEKLFHVALGG